MFVCICNKVTDGQIREACGLGAHSLDCLEKQLNLGTCCGKCRDCAQGMLREAQATQSFDYLAAAAS